MKFIEPIVTTNADNILSYLILIESNHLKNATEENKLLNLWNERVW